MNETAVSLCLNPTAGRGRAGKRLARIKSLLETRGLAIDVFESRASGDLEKEITHRVNSGVRRIIVAGGDGSVHEAVNGLLVANVSAALGVIPTGTGNDFAKACGIPLNWQRATQELADRISTQQSPRKIDVGRMNDRFFANGVGIGLDAKVTRIANTIRWPIGDFVYPLAVLRCLYDGIATPELRITSIKKERLGPVTLVNVSNGAWVGGMFHIAPMARNTDGVLDLMIAGPVSRARILGLLPKLMRGQHLNEPEIVHDEVLQLSIAAAGPVESHLDGEIQAPQTEFKISVQRAALDLL